MEAFKPLLPLGDGTVLSQCIDTFHVRGVEQVVVVTGERGDEVEVAARVAGAEVVHNADFEQGMFSSILAGIRTLRPVVSAFFLLPVDIPMVRRDTVSSLIEVYERTSPLILYPNYKGERGHPPLVSLELVPAVVNYDGHGGLRALLEQFESGAKDVDVADPGTVHDLDFPADYELVRGRLT